MNRKQLIPRIIIILVVIGAFAVIMQSMRSIEKGQYEERVTYGNTLTMQMATNVSTMIHQSWDFAHYARNRVDREQFDNKAQLRQYLKNIEQDSQRQFLFVRKDGHLLKSDGIDAIWQAQNLLITGKEEFYVSDASMFGNEGVSNMYFVLPLHTPLMAGNSEYTHLIMAQRLDVFDPFFTLDQSLDTSLTFIIRSNGTQLYQKDKASELSKVYNVLTFLKNAQFSYDESYETLQTYLKTGIDNTIRVSINGTRYYLSEYHLDISDWILVILVPEKTLQTGTDALADIISRNIIYIYSSVALVVIVIVGSAILKSLQKQKEAANKLRIAADAERQASIAKTYFLSAMSHDIRTPMNAIVNYTNLAIKKKDDSDFVSDSLQKIKVSSAHLLTLINDVLDISRIESGKMNITPVNFDVQQLFQEIYEIVEPRCREYQVHLETDGTFPVRYLYGDTVRLKQIFLNIITNAIKYNVADGQVHVSVSEARNEEQKVLLTFVCSDTGIGMSEEFQKIMYQEFARETDSRVNLIPGTGLGLAICHQLVDAMNGTITCQSEEQKGTTFTIQLSLPMASAQSAASHASSGIVKAETDWKKLLSGTRVLAAEDNKMNWGMLNILLQEVGIEADWVQNGKECVDTLCAAKENAYDIVLMDIRMPVMDGREATRHIRASKEEWLKRIPIIALSADAFAEDKLESQAAGMNEHITKPIDESVLYQTMFSFLNGKRED